MVMVSLIYAPDEDLGPDPHDPQARPRRVAEVLGDNDDVLVIWRTYDDHRCLTHVVGQGVYENVRPKRLAKLLDRLLRF